MGSNFPLPWSDLSYGHCDGYAKLGVAAKDGGADLDFGHLSVEGPRHEAWPDSFTHGFTQCILVSARLLR